MKLIAQYDEGHDVAEYLAELRFDLDTEDFLDFVYGHGILAYYSDDAVAHVCYADESTKNRFEEFVSLEVMRK